MSTKYHSSGWLVFFAIFAITLAYAILNNLIAANISSEFFQEILPQLMGLVRLPDNSVLASTHIALIGSWWIALVFALIVTAASRLGSRRKMGINEIVRMLPIPIMAMLVVSNLFGWIAYLSVDVQSVVPDWHKAYGDQGAAKAVAANTVNLFAYVLGAALAIWVSIQVWRKRLRATMVEPTFPTLLPLLNTRIGSAVITAVVTTALVLLLLILGSGLAQLLLFVALLAFFLRLFFDPDFIYLRLGVFSIGSVIATLSLNSIVGKFLAGIFGLPLPDFSVPGYVYIGLIVFSSLMISLHFKLHHENT